MLKSGDQAYPYESRLYHKEKTESKIQLSIEMIQKLQIRSERAIQQYWLIVQFAYLFAMHLEGGAFNLALRTWRKKKIGSIIEFVKGTSLDQIKKELQVT